jgi:hypothetical protein
MELVIPRSAKRLTDEKKKGRWGDEKGVIELDP